MKKHTFLMPLATAVAALASGGSADAKTVVPSSALEQASPGTVGASSSFPENLVIERAGEQLAQYGHTSHGSHSSHASHASHTSSR